MLIYAGSVALTTIACARERPVRDVALVPAALVTMHVAHGFGFLAGCWRFGFPWGALRRVAGLAEATRRAGTSGASAEQVYSPSLEVPAGA
jgi:hypothetical protein